MNISVMKLSLALLLLLVGGTFTSTPTYNLIDEETGEKVTCQQCPRGTFVAKHCTSTSKTECQPCPDKHYTSYWNYVEKCRFCNIICEDREQVKHECNATHNRVCECKPGYLQDSDYCVKDCTKEIDIDDPECDTQVIEFVVKQNLTSVSIRRLLKVANTRLINGKRRPQEKIRALLRRIKKADPNHALLRQLMDLLKEANITHLEKELKKQFLGREEETSS